MNHVSGNCRPVSPKVFIIIIVLRSMGKMFFGSMGLMCSLKWPLGKMAHRHLASPVSSWGMAWVKSHTHALESFSIGSVLLRGGTLNGATTRRKCNHANTFIQSKSWAGLRGGGREGCLECDDTKETNSPAGEHTSPSERVSFGRRQHSTVLCSHNPKGNQRCQKNK